MKRIKPYILAGSIVLGILAIIFFIKGIYPFGNNSLIWGDMHDQITAFYYHFYDSIFNEKSLLIDFSESGGVNFIGILAYYILSPFSILTLLVKRENIYLMVSVIIGLKILLSSLTCLYVIRKYYKKIPMLLSVLLAIIYAFSGYSLVMYQITPWIDAMYMLPLIFVGLKKVLDLEKPTMYIVTLSLSLIFSFYVSMMVIIFIFLGSFIYLLVYKEKEERKKAILLLGISTILSLLISSFIVVPSYMQISVSSRMGFSIKTLLNSKMGPITDKTSMFLFGGIMYVGLFLLIKNFKKYKKFLSFYIPVILTLLIPVIIEPINKIWHFGSYAFFPYRFGFITIFLLIFGAAYAFDNYEGIKQVNLKNSKIISAVLTILICTAMFIVIYVNYNNFQSAIYKLTISTNHQLLLFLIILTVISIVGCFIILLLNKGLNKFALSLIFFITITHIIVNSTLYLGIDSKQDILTKQYKELNLIEKTYQEDNYYRVKNQAENMIMNSGMVMRYHTLDHFTSLTDRNTLESLKKLGYSSMWVKTFSRGGNLFLDSILANKYIMTRSNIDNKYYQVEYDFDDIKLYSLKQTPSYGYLINNNDTIFDKENSFIISNSIYQNITGKNDYIFDIIDNFKLTNIELSLSNGNTYYEIIDKEDYAYIEADIEVTKEKTIYLEILRSLVNNDNYQMYEKFNIYINDNLFKQKAFTENDNGVLNLGTYNNEKVNIKIELLKSIDLDNITIGIMDNEKYEDFIKNNYIDTNIEYKRNKINSTVTTNTEKILMLPISYNEGYQATNNGKKTELLKVYDNFIGIKLNNGENNIEISYTPKGFTPCLIISIVSLLITVILIKTNFINKILKNKQLINLSNLLYIVLYLGIITIVYIGGTIVFMLSYFIQL